MSIGCGSGFLCAPRVWRGTVRQDEPYKRFQHQGAAAVRARWEGWRGAPASVWFDAAANDSAATTKARAPPYDAPILAILPEVWFSGAAMTFPSW